MVRFYLVGVNIWICVLDYLRFYPSECNKCEGGYWLGTVLQHGSSYLGDCSGGPHLLPHTVAITWYLCLQRKDKRNKTKVRDFLTAETIKSMVFCSKRTRICRRWWDRKFYVVAGRADREKEGKEQFTKKGASVRYLQVFCLTLLQKSQSFSGSIMQCKI